MALQFGKTSWDAKQYQGKSEEKEGRNLILKDGKNLVRIVTSAYCYFVHICTFEGDSQYKFGRKIKCAINDCPLCDDKKKYPLQVC